MQLLKAVYKLRLRIELIIVDRIQCCEDPPHFARARQFYEIDRSVVHAFEAKLAEAVSVNAQIHPLISSKLANWDSCM